jgi:alpha-beta hydrolase superfamily lysophospholipase
MGVILVSPLASGARVVFPNVKNGLLDKVFCPSISRIRNVKAPLLILHGTNDEVIHISNGKVRRDLSGFRVWCSRVEEKQRQE